MYICLFSLWHIFIRMDGLHSMWLLRITIKILHFFWLNVAVLSMLRIVWVHIGCSIKGIKQTRQFLVVASLECWSLSLPKVAGAALSEADFTHIKLWDMSKLKVTVLSLVTKHFIIVYTFTCSTCFDHYPLKCGKYMYFCSIKLLGVY